MPCLTALPRKVLDGLFSCVWNEFVGVIRKEKHKIVMQIHMYCIERPQLLCEGNNADCDVSGTKFC